MKRGEDVEQSNEKTRDQVIVEHVIFVRDEGQTYVATARGKRVSCTAGREQAAQALAKKLMGDKPYTFGRAFPNNDRAYMVIAGGEQAGR